MLTTEEVTRLAQETGLHLPYWDDKDADETGEVGGPPAGWTMVSPFGPPLERFARAVEREAYRRAAAECRRLGNAPIWIASAYHCAEAIEALGREE